MIGNCLNVPDWFSQTVELAHERSDELGVLIVANVQGRTVPLDDYETDSIVTEFLTSSELDDLLEGFARSDIYAEAVLDEEGFLDWIAHRRVAFPRRQILVYNLAQNGTGAARLSLVPSLCRLYRLPLLDSSSYSVSLARHKFHSGIVLARHGLPVARSWLYEKRGWVTEPPPLGIYLIAKPTFESASIGIHEESVFRMEPDSATHLDSIVRTFRQPLTVQEFIPGYEAEVPVFEADGPRTIATVGIALDRCRNLGTSFLKYEEVAEDEYQFYDFAFEFKHTAKEAMAIAAEAFRCLGLEGVGRVDFRISVQGSPKIIEIACKPHLTTHSSFAWLIESMDRQYSDLVKFLVGSAIKRHGL